MKISVLIPFKSDNGGYRDANLAYVTSRYQTLMPEIELVIGEDQSELFNKSRAVNQAARKATGELLIIADADVFFETQLIDKIVAIAHGHPWIIPYSRCFILNREGSLEVTKTGRIELPQSVCSLEVEKVCFYYGGLMNVVSRKAFEKVGGMDERFFGWGEEDDSFARTLDTIVGKHYRMEETIFHLWHPRANDDHPHREFNKQLGKRYRQVEGNILGMRKLLQERRKGDTAY
jgi:hypothetical protein